MAVEDDSGELAGPEAQRLTAAVTQFLAATSRSWSAAVFVRSGKVAWAAAFRPAALSFSDCLSGAGRYAVVFPG